MLKKVLKPLASLKLTVVLLALSMALVLAGTFAQKDSGIWDVQKQYFHSGIAWTPLSIFWNKLPGVIPLPGGYLLGTLLLVNLLSAHTLRFKISWKRLGIILIHLGIILLLVGEGITSAMQVESRMTIDEGSYANYSQDQREIELAFLEPAGGDQFNVVAVSDHQLRKEGKVIEDARLPVKIKVERFFGHSTVVPKSSDKRGVALATAGTGVEWSAVKLPPNPGTSNVVDTPSAFVTLSKGAENLGTYLVSIHNRGQEISVGGKKYEMVMRFRRYYHPYALHLNKFSFDRYTGTDTPRNYSSEVRLIDPVHHENREVKIWMNHPLRHAGSTFFQSSFDSMTERTTELQVVTNPGWVMPYVACVVAGVGLLTHFLMVLINFLRAQAAATPPPIPVAKRPGKAARKGEEYTLPARSSWTKIAPLLAVAVCAFYLVYVIIPKDAGEYHLAAFGSLPVSGGGRVQPLDTLARTTLKISNAREVAYKRDTSYDANGRQKYKDTSISATQWMADTLAHRPEAVDYLIARIDFPDVVSQLKLDGDEKRFSLRNIFSNKEAMGELEREADIARKIPEKERTLYQQRALEIHARLNRAFQYYFMPESLYFTFPMDKSEDWRPLSVAMREAEQTGKTHEALAAFDTIITAYANKKPAEFNRAVSHYEGILERYVPEVLSQVRLEYQFNRIDPFMTCMVFYLGALVLATVSWLIWRKPLGNAAYAILILTAVVHTLGLLARIYISGRPPVTNLASSAIFIAWGAVIFSVGLESIFRNGIGTVTAAFTGFSSLLIADFLSADNDTLSVMQAVLDTNLWLATHVVCVTLGYTATFVAGVIGMIYISMGVMTPNLDKPTSTTLRKMIYGTVCFATFFSFIGTVLGGIWADQSWGRFWGWDPKENGAVLVVLWNAVILHSRWAGWVRDRGVAILAVGGNIITAWSWFGTNMLGVGLHSYGFTGSGQFWLAGFVASQLVMIGIASMPQESWGSGAMLKGE